MLPWGTAQNFIVSRTFPFVSIHFKVHRKLCEAKTYMPILQMEIRHRELQGLTQDYMANKCKHHARNFLTPTS